MEFSLTLAVSIAYAFFVEKYGDEDERHKRHPYAQTRETPKERAGVIVGIAKQQWPDRSPKPPKKPDIYPYRRSLKKLAKSWRRCKVGGA